MVKRKDVSGEDKEKGKEIVKFTETHEWVKVKDDVGTIGITTFAVKKLTDLVHIDLPEVGQHIEQGVPFGEIESVKTVSELIAPISGKIIEVNGEVLNNIELISESPLDKGWLLKVKVENLDELDSLMTQEEYDEYLETTEEEE